MSSPTKGAKDSAICPRLLRRGRLLIGQHAAYIYIYIYINICMYIYIYIYIYTYTYTYTYIYMLLHIHIICFLHLFGWFCRVLVSLKTCEPHQ